MNKVLAIDIGGSKMMAGYIESDNGDVLVSESLAYDSIPTQKSVTQSIRKLLAEMPGNIIFDRVGVTIPGLCDPKNGIWVYAPFSGIRDFYIANEVRSITGKPVFIENDVNACAVAEMNYGCCRDTDDFLWVTISNGCGGSLVLNGNLYTGSSNGAGEIGHVCVDYDIDMKCGCGKAGCLEAVASGVGIGRRYCKAAGIAYNPDINGKYVSELARDGDRNAVRIMDETGMYIGRALASAANILNPGKIVLGGGVALSFDLFEQSMKKEFITHLFTGANEALSIEKTELGYDAALKGAAAICI